MAETTRSFWAEYDAAADARALRDLTGESEEAAFAALSRRARDEIDGDPEAFALRVRECAYARCMETRPSWA